VAILSQSRLGQVQKRMFSLKDSIKEELRKEAEESQRKFVLPWVTLGLTGTSIWIYSRWNN